MPWLLAENDLQKSAVGCKCGFAEKAGALLTHMKVDSSGNFRTPRATSALARPSVPADHLCHQHVGTGYFNVSVSGS